MGIRPATAGSVLCGLLFALAAAGAPAQSPDPAESRRLHDLFEADWEWSMRTYPEWASHVGDHRYGARLNDRSLESDAPEYAYARDRLAKLRAIDRTRLAGADRISYDILVSRTADWLEWEKHRGMRMLSLNGQDGIHLGFGELLRVSPAATEADARNILARMRAFPAAVDQVIARLREGIALGWVTPRNSMERVPAQIDGQLADDPAKSTLYEPFTRLGPGIPSAASAQLADEGRRALLESVYPAMRKLRAFVVDESCRARPRTARSEAIPAARRPTSSSCGSARPRASTRARSTPSAMPKSRGCGRQWKSRCALRASAAASRSSSPSSTATRGSLLGALKIAELRDRAQAALGPRFDIRQFHKAVLDSSAVPLGVLERGIDEWIAENK